MWKLKVFNRTIEIKTLKEVKKTIQNYEDLQFQSLEKGNQKFEIVVFKQLSMFNNKKVVIKIKKKK